jgi:hypothetical protein
MAFSFAGIHDPDEAERIIEAERDVTPEPVPKQPAQYPLDEFRANLPKWQAIIESGRKSADEIIATVETKGSLSEEQKDIIRACEPIDIQEEDAA